MVETNKAHTPFYKYNLKFAISRVGMADEMTIIVNHKFNIYKGIRRSISLSRYYDLIRDFDDIIIEGYDMDEVNKKGYWKIWVNDDLLERLVLDRENEWYNSHQIFIKTPSNYFKKGGNTYEDEI